MSLKARDVVRIGIIGPSWWVNYWHLAALKNHPNAEITAVCGARLRDSAEVCEKYGASAAAYTDVETMLESAPLDGVIVCTPNHLHHPQTLAALRHGLHVICEKPVAMYAAQAREMAETARSGGLIGMTNFPYRDNPAVQKMKNLIETGYLGTPLHVYGAYHGGYVLHGRPGWRGERDRSGAGILGDLGSHLIDLARFVTGDEFSAVCSHSMTALWEEGQKPALVRTGDSRAGNRNDDSCCFLAEFQSGAQGIFHTSWVAYQGAAQQHQEVEVYGSEGRLRVLSSFAGVVLDGMRRGSHTWEKIPVEGSVRPEDVAAIDEDYFRPGRHTPTNTTYRWIEAIRTGNHDVKPDLEDGWRAQQVIDAVIQASAERRWIEVER